MKKLFALLVCVLLVFALASCGGDTCSHRDADGNSLCDNSGFCAVCDAPIGMTEGVSYDLSGDGSYAEVIGYSGNSARVIIASSYQGVPVKNIYRGAFEETSITQIIIPDSVTSIGDHAFSSCTSLTSVVIPGSVTSIGDYTFYDCDSLTSVTIPYSVTSIGYAAFSHCSSLTSVTIGNSVTSIGNFAFEYCSSLTSVVIGDSVTSIGSSAFLGCYRLVEVVNNSFLNITAGSSDYGYVAHYAKDVHTGEIKGVTNVDGYLFYTSSNGVHYLVGYIGNDTELTLPDSYNGENYDINNYAFYNCSRLTSVVIGDSVTSIGERAFRYCTNLTSVVIGDSVTSIGDYAFHFCDSLTSVVIPDSVTSIGDYTFYDCDSLTSVVIGDSVTSIGDHAFSSCTSLTSVVIGDSVTSIGEWAFNYCYSLTSVVIPDSVTSIGEHAFSSCDSLTSVVIGNGVTSIGDYAFEGCTSLTSVHISDIAAWCNISFGNNYSNPLYYAKNLYVGGTLVEDLVIPEGVTSIGSYAFSHCSSLTSVVIGDSVTTIGDDAFFYCVSLKNIKYRGTSSQWNSISKGTRWNVYYDNGYCTIGYTMTYNYAGE